MHEPAAEGQEKLVSSQMPCLITPEIIASLAGQPRLTILSVGEYTLKEEQMS